MIERSFQSRSANGLGKLELHAHAGITANIGGTK